MKRTPLKRRVGLKARRGLSGSANERPAGPRRTLRPRSPRATAEADERRSFVAEFLPGKPCELAALFGGCFGRMTVHERIKRSHGGAIVPGAKAEAQGQSFHALCAGHNDWVEDHPAEARRRGLA